MGELQRKMTTEELHWWMAYNEKSPIGPERWDYNFAMVASMIANVHKTKGKPVSIKDTVLKWGGDKKKMVRGVQAMRKLLCSIPAFKRS